MTSLAGIPVGESDAHAVVATKVAAKVAHSRNELQRQAPRGERVGKKSPLVGIDSTNAHPPGS